MFQTTSKDATPQTVTIALPKLSNRAGHYLWGFGLTLASLFAAHSAADKAAVFGPLLCWWIGFSVACGIGAIVRFFCALEAKD